MISKTALMFGIWFLILPIVYSAEACPQRELNELFNETIHFVNSTGNEVNNGYCNVTLYYPNTTVWKNNINCTKRALDIHGYYDCNITSGTPYGIYITSAKCTSGSEIAVGDGCFESVNLKDISYITDSGSLIAFSIVSLVIMLLAMFYKDRYGKYLTLILIIFGAISILIISSGIYETISGESNVFGNTVYSFGIYFTIIIFVFILLLFLYYIFKEFKDKIIKGRLR